MCVASGDGFSSVIDTDVCFDEIGVPFIPSRRLKGVLREAAEFIEIDREVIEEIFGKSRSKIGGSLQMDNAFLADYETIKQELKDFPKDKVKNLFTYTRAATAIHATSGSAKEDTLRFTRVIKQYSPKNEESLVFSANCKVDSKYENVLLRICKALRSIGYRRNRGFGAVKCVFERKNKTNDETKSEANNFIVPVLDADTKYQIPITLTNKAPLIVSSSNNDKTEDYISGTALMGAFAWAYPDKDSARFTELFLNKNVIFSNLYLGYKPAPLCYSKLKCQETYINQAKGGMPKDDTPKPLKGKYLDTKQRVIDIKKEVIYHYVTGKNAKKKREQTAELLSEKKDDESLLYMQTALCANQNFKGFIQGEGKDLNEILKLLEPKASLCIGKSKTAQYANCNVSIEEPIPIKIEKIEAKTETIAVLLHSDVILIENGFHTCDVCDLILALNIPNVNKKNYESYYHKDKSSFMFKIVTGYSGIWNLKKPHIRAFKSGSVLFLKNVSGTFAKEIYIGAKINEGFGHCEIMLLDKMPEVKKYEKSDNQTGNQNEACGAYADLIKEANHREAIKEKALRFAEKNKLSPSIITSSQIGRVRLMLKQSKNQGEFKKRIEAIKTDSVRKKFQRYFELNEMNSADDIHKDYKDYADYKLYWDTVFRWHKYQRKLDDHKKRGVSS